MKLLFYLSFGSLLYFTSCVSYSSFQSARTLEKGKVSISVGAGSNERAEEGYGDVAFRVGVEDSLDMGLKFNSTSFGSILVMLDVKKQLPSQSKNISNAVGFGVSPVFDDEEGVAFHIPAYISFHSTNDFFTTYINPRVFYYMDFLKADGFNNSGLGYGNSLGFKIGKKFAVMPEWSFFVAKYQDEAELNNFFSIGLGWNVQ